jgi:hypothetical protein
MLSVHSLHLPVVTPFPYLPGEMEWLRTTSASCIPCARTFSNYGKMG